jgi:SAM-dependent methyltransferase
VELKLRAWHDYIPKIPQPELSTHVDLGAGNNPRNPFGASKLIATDFHLLSEKSEFVVVVADLTKTLPFSDQSINSFSAFDVIEHIPRWERASDGQITFPFVNLMSEIFRCLAPGGYFIAVTPAYPSNAAFQDPTHINFITEETMKYFGGDEPWAGLLGYGFTGKFEIVKNERLLGRAPFLGTSLEQLKSRRNPAASVLRSIVKRNFVLFGIYRIFKGQTFFEERPTHLLWVLKKADGLFS